MLEDPTARGKIPQLFPAGCALGLGRVAQAIFAMPDRAHQITLRGDGSADEAAALAARVGALPELQRLEVLPWKELTPEVAAVLDITGVYGLVVLVIVFVAAAAGVANVMLMATFERRRELGMLLSLGTAPGRLVRMILVEATILGLSGVILGSFLGGALVFWQGQVGINPTTLSSDEVGEIAWSGLNFSADIYPYLRPSDFVPGFVGVTLVSVLASLWPALHTARLEPMEAMRS